MCCIVLLNGWINWESKIVHWQRVDGCGSRNHNWGLSDWEKHEKEICDEEDYETHRRETRERKRRDQESCGHYNHEERREREVPEEPMHDNARRNKDFVRREKKTYRKEKGRRKDKDKRSKERSDMEDNRNCEKVKSSDSQNSNSSPIQSPPQKQKSKRIMHNLKEILRLRKRKSGEK